LNPSFTLSQQGIHKDYNNDSKNDITVTTSIEIEQQEQQHDCFDDTTVCWCVETTGIAIISDYL